MNELMDKERVPPGQHLVDHLPVLHYSRVPAIDLKDWRFKISGLVEQAYKLSYAEFRALPQAQVKADFHCVTSWSKLDNLWEGVLTEEIVKISRALSAARYVMVYSYDGYSTNLSLEDFLANQAIFAWGLNGKELPPEYGGPLRLVVHHLYAWKSAKWVNGLEFMAEDRKGFWESRGYHNHGDPWKEERYG